MKTIKIILLFIIPMINSFGQGLIIENGEIVCNGEIKIVIEGNGNIINNDAFTSDESEVILRGNSNQTISGTSKTSFYKLTINISDGDVLIGDDIFVTNNLTLTSGDVDLQNNIIDLSSSGVILSETESNKIKIGDPINNTGKIQYTRTINNVTDYDPANLGVQITTDKDLGNITVIRGHQTQAGSGLFSSNKSIARYYEIPGIGELDGISNSLKMQYWDSELGGSHPTEANLKMYQLVTQSGNDYWTELSTTLNMSSNVFTPNADPYNDYIYQHSVIFNKKFSFGSGDSPLPIELLSFDASMQNNKVKLDWETSSEINNDYFILQKSTDTRNWKYISKIEGAGQSNTRINYFDYDYTPYSGLSYYRLKQVDFDGKYSYSENRQIFIENSYDIRMFPNPTNGKATVTGENIKNIEILGIHGNLIKLVLNDKNTIDLTDCQKGTYIIKITADQVYYKKLILY